MTVAFVLVGSGHAHLRVLREAARLRASGVEPVLVSPPTFDYSGLASGVLSGAVPPGRARIDASALARRHGVRHIPVEMVGMDRAARRLTLTDGSVIPYDAVSFNIGSVVSDPEGWADREAVWPVKPLAALLALRDRLETTLALEGDVPAIVIAGDGPTGFEIAASLIGLHERHGRATAVTLIGPDAEAQWAPGQSGRTLTRLLDRRGLIRIAGEIVEHEAGQIRLRDGRALACDHLVLATGLKAPCLTQGMGVPLDGRGRIRVMPCLHSVGDDRLFAAGDCATVDGSPRPFAGVFGVRAADVLIANLCALGAGTPQRPYRPQAQWLSIMDLGDGTAMALRGGLWWRGRAALWLKRRLDLGFVDQHRA
ncbi:NAD(P)/FAD-dependent oxidoreductase [Brevundimonas sp.]